MSLGTEQGDHECGRLAEAASSRSGLLRAAADGELSAADEAALQRHLRNSPDDALVIEFERGLRRAVASMPEASEPLPKGLAERTHRTIEQAVRSESSENSTNGERARARGGRVMVAMSVAAAVMLSGGLWYFAGHVFPQRPAAMVRQDIPMPLREAITTFVATYHQECEIHADLVPQWYRITSMNQVPAGLERVLGQAPDVSTIQSAGFTLLGAGPCAVPGRGRSFRLVLRAPASLNGSMVSVHIQQDTGDLSFEPGRTFLLEPTKPDAIDAASKIYVWRRDGLIYFLTSGSPEAMTGVMEALGAEPPSGTI